MGLEFATGTLNIGTGAPTTNYSITGKTPATGAWKAVVLYTVGRPETTDASGETDIQLSIGAATSDTARWSMTIQSDHAVTTSATDRYNTDAACLALLDTAGALVAALDFVQFTSDGADFVVDDQFPAAVEVGYVLIGGSDVTDALAGTFQINTTTGNFSYTSITSFEPAFALMASAFRVGIPGGGISAEISVGAMTPSAQAVLAVVSRDNEATTITGSYCRAGEIIADLTTATNVKVRLSFTQFLSTGWELNLLETDAAPIRVGFLALKGGTYAIGDFTTATDTTEFNEAHGIATAVKGAMFFSANRAASTQDAATNQSEFSIGASDGSANNCQYARDKDAAADSAGFTAVSHDQCYLNADNAAPQVLEGEGHVNSFDGTNIKFQMTDADNANNFVWYAAFANALVTPDNLMGQVCL